MKLYIKNMVCLRCKTVVKNELIRLGIHFSVVDLGEVEIPDNISAGQREQLKLALLRSGLELLDDKKSVLIQKIKNVIIESVHHSEEPLVIKNCSCTMNLPLPKLPASSAIAV